MKQYTVREFVRVLNKNGFTFSRQNGSHAVFVRAGKETLCIPNKGKGDTIFPAITKRLANEFNLVL